MYLDIYKENQKQEILNRHRILSDRYSPVAGKPLFEIIQDNCKPESNRQTCESRVSNIMIGALERQEQDIQNNFQELMTDLTSEDPSEALRKVMFALEEDEEQKVTLTHIRSRLEGDDSYRAQFDFHSDRLAGHLNLSERERFIQNYIKEPAGDLRSILGILILPGLIRGASGLLAGSIGRLGSNSKAMWDFAAGGSRSRLLGTTFFLVFGGEVYSNISNYYGDISPRVGFIEDLYYISPETSRLVDQSQFLMSEKLDSDSFIEAIVAPVVLIALIAGFFLTRSGLTAWRHRGLEKQVKSLPSHLRRLGIDSPAADNWNNMRAWDMKALEKTFNSLKLKLQNAGNSLEVEAINKSWNAVNRFYTKQTARARRLINARRQMGASDDIADQNPLSAGVQQQIGNGNGSSRLKSLQTMLKREEDLFELRKYNDVDHPVIQGFFEHLRTLP